MIDISHLLDSKWIKIKDYALRVEALDGKCMALKVAVRKGIEYYQETITGGDFIDVRKKIKEGKRMSEILNCSLLFLKLMIQGTKANHYQIVELDELPWKKVIKGETTLKEKIQEKIQGHKTKGIAIIISPSLAVIVPLVIIDVPIAPTSVVVESKKETKPISRIKSMFFDGRQTN